MIAEAASDPPGVSSEQPVRAALPGCMRSEGCPMTPVEPTRWCAWRSSELSPPVAPSPGFCLHAFRSGTGVGVPAVDEKCAAQASLQMQSIGDDRRGDNVIRA